MSRFTSHHGVGVYRGCSSSPAKYSSRPSPIGATRTVDRDAIFNDLFDKLPAR